MLAKVHISLNEKARFDKAAKSAVRDKLRDLGAEDLNEKRLHRYGVASVTIDDEDIPQIEEMAEVEVVEKDEVKVISKEE